MLPNSNGQNGNGQPTDNVTIDKQLRTAMVDVAIVNDRNTRKKEHKKLEKYQGLR